MDTRDIISWILFVGILMLCLAANSFNPTHDKDGRTGKTVAIVIGVLILLFGLASL